jgi:hypothetical protein
VKRLPHEGQETAPRSTSLPQFSQKYLGFTATDDPVIQRFSFCTFNRARTVENGQDGPLKVVQNENSLHRRQTENCCW